MFLQANLALCSSTELLLYQQKKRRIGRIGLDKKRERKDMTLTSNKNILIRCSHKLHCFLREEGHVLVDGVVGDV